MSRRAQLLLAVIVAAALALLALLWACGVVSPE